ncbi:MAG: hypothetical protein K6E21_02250 [Bacilli bacterium]|nr:hypothetical protein [Bacilli bacterium]
MVQELFLIICFSLSTRNINGRSFSVDYTKYQDDSFISYTGKNISSFIYIGNETPTDFLDISRFPNAIKVAEPSFKYNCHSFAWRYRGNLNNINNYTNCIINNEGQFLQDPDYLGTFCYYTVIYGSVFPSSFPFISPLLTGDIIVYENTDYGGAMNMDGNSHSAYVIAPSTSFSGTLVRSKWCEHGVYEHYALECPYYQEQTILPGNDIVPETTFSVYRLMHYYGYTSVNSYVHNKHSICCTTISENEPHRFGDSNGHLVCLDCLYDTGIILYEEEDPSL